MSLADRLSSKFRICSWSFASRPFFGQSLSRGHYQPIYQPPEGVYLLNIPQFLKPADNKHNSLNLAAKICSRSFDSGEFKKLRRQMQRKRHIKIELWVKLSLLRLFHFGRVVQNRRSALSLARHKWFSCKGKNWKIYCCELALSSKPQIWKFHVVVWQTTSKHCIKKRAARVARLFFFIQPIKSLIFGVVVDVAVVKS